jgi:hypothetical protein
MESSSITSQFDVASLVRRRFEVVPRGFAQREVLELIDELARVIVELQQRDQRHHEAIAAFTARMSSMIDDAVIDAMSTARHREVRR